MAATLVGPSSTGQTDNEPIIAHFTNGNLKLSEPASRSARFCCYKPKYEVDKRGYKQLLVGEVENSTLVGKRQKTDLYCRYYLGVFDEKTAEMTIRSAQLFMLQPKVIDDHNERNKENRLDSPAEKTFREKTDSLVQVFGSAKQKRALGSRQKNVVDNASVVGRVEAIASKATISSPLEGSAGAVNDILPPMNMDAQSLSEVYNIKEIIGYSVLMELKAASRDLVEAGSDQLAEWCETERFPEFILKHLMILPSESEAREEQCSYILYLWYLMQVFKLTYKEVKKKDPLPDISEEVKKRLLADFSLFNDGKRCIPKRLKDKVLCYILVIALIIDDFSLECTPLMRDLRLGPARLSQHLKAIGCRIDTKTPRKRKADEANNGEDQRSFVARLVMPVNKDQEEGRPLK